MFSVAESIKTFPIKANDIIKDIFLPVSRRNGYSTKNKLVLPIYFYRYIGVKGEGREYYEELHDFDMQLLKLGSKCLRFTNSLSILFNEDITDRTQDVWGKIDLNDNVGTCISTFLKAHKIIDSFFNDKILIGSIYKSLSEVINLFIKNNSNVNLTMVKNFSLKLINWLCEYTPSLFGQFNLNDGDEIINPKVLFYGDIKQHEIYFLILFSKIGCDVIYINTMTDCKFSEIDKNDQLSFIHKFERFEAQKEYPMAKVNLINYVRKEKNYEELAKLSISTVKIRTFDRNGDVLGVGSGVVVDTSGLIVTNYHVIRDGFYYGVTFEGMEEFSQIETYTVINTDIPKDLALIRIYKTSIPIKVDEEDDVVRGQKVVAIGSPLGLMNTFSEGIISGFRNGYRCDFLQTTAPMSPGSSGGALLNIYGELIGIASAGYVDGQNINLAVPSRYVLELLRDKYTIINQEIINSCSIFNFQNVKIFFDGFFNHHDVNNYKIALYQSRQDRTNVSNIIRDKIFINALESYYIENIKRILIKYNITVYNFELGLTEHIFSYSYNVGKVYNNGWKSLEV